MKDKLIDQPVSRRTFLKGTSTSLVIGMYLPMLASKSATAAQPVSSATANAFIKIHANNTVTILSKHIEFGQGTFTGLATLAAEELDADWSQIRAEHAPADVKLYVNSLFGIQGTGGSTAIASSYLTMRKAGAHAKQWLKQAAAKLWQVPMERLEVNRGIIFDKTTGKKATFGNLVSTAAGMDSPTAEVMLKTPEQFKLIGRDLPKLDTADKSSGNAQYTMDVHLDDMVVATVAHSPKFGGTVASFDATNTLKVKGVIDVKQIATGVAVYATSTFAAIKGRRELKIQWDNSKAEQRSSKVLFNDFHQSLASSGRVAGERGQIKDVLSRSENTIELSYEFPYLAHAPMEPLDVVVQHKNGAVTTWFGSQIPTIDQATIAQVFGVKPEKVQINTLLAGGSFGRRTTPDSGLALEAALVTKAFEKSVPVKLVWTREDDIQGGRYRPMAVHKVKATFDDNNILGWQQEVATQSIVANSPFAGMIQNGIDPTSVEGAHNQPYAVPHFQVNLTDMHTGVPVLWWRSVGHTHTGYVVETLIDTLLEKTNADPVDGRVALLAEFPREAQVLVSVKKMAEQAGKPAVGRMRGVAMVKSFGSYVAQIAEVSKGSDGMPKVHRVWCAVDCGVAVNPNVIRAQIEGGIGYGLDAILHGEITLAEGGQVNQSNFHNYPILRINEMPEIEVEIIKSAHAPTGVGEVGVPPIGPAVANAWRRLTGQQITRLPFAKSINT